jgi:hypothetical protein
MQGIGSKTSQDSMTARSVLMQAESVPILQCKRGVVGVRKQSSRGKGLWLVENPVAGHRQYHREDTAGTV